MLALLLQAMLVQADMPTLIQTPYGPVRGFQSSGTNAWRGIPYAKAPIGDLRFRPPQPPAKRTDVLEATDFGASCVQEGSFPDDPFLKHKAWISLNLTISSEDCLYVNVYTPSSASANSKLPVMLYFHAGEFRFGASNDQENNWPFFAHGRVLLVTANVRLGMFGFAALDALRSRDPSGSTGNYGMQDQRAVMRWVRDSISTFGGDAARVTIFGESSGGSSVGFHLVSPFSKGLFAGAILESPGLTQSHSFQQQETDTQFVASALTAARSPACAWPTSNLQAWRSFPGLTAQGTPLKGTFASLADAQTNCLARAECAFVVHAVTEFKLYGTGSAGALSPPIFFNGSSSSATSGLYMRMASNESVVPCMVQASPADLVRLNINPIYRDTFETDASAPTEDGVELPAPLQLLTRQQSNVLDIPMLGGANLDEGTEFMGLTPPLACNATEQQFIQWALHFFGPNLGMLVPSVYKDLIQPAPLCESRGLPGPTSEWWQKAMRAAGDAAILCRTREILLTSSQAFWYEFRATPIYSVNMFDLAYMGAFHGAEVPFVFGDDFELSSDGEHMLSNVMGCFWTNFAATGDPNNGPCIVSQISKSVPSWPLISTGNAFILTNTTLSIEGGLKKEVCDLFKQYP